MINRNSTTKLIKLLNYFPVIGIIGPRQVGKTTISQLLRKEISKESIYIDLENPRDRAKLYDPVLFFENNINKCVILDEVQLNPELFPILRSMVDIEREAARFILLGSAFPELIRDSSESLAGRIAYLELCPFNLTEVLPIGFKDHWFKGGFPDAILAPDNELTSQWHNNFVKTYIEKDLPMLGLNIQRTIIEKLWTMIAHIHGNVLNMSTIGRALELSSTTIKKYLDFLEKAFLIRQLQPFHVNIKKRLVKSPKVYIRDSGILHYLLNIASFDDLNLHPYVGNSWEGYVIEQVLQQTEHKLKGYYYRTHEGAECDLVLVKSNKPEIGIEVKYSASPKPTKGMLQSLKDLNTKTNYIVTPDTDDYLISNQVRVCCLKDFLTLYLPKHLN